MNNSEPKLSNPQAIDASYLVRAKATYFPTFVRIWIPNEPYQKLSNEYDKKTKSSSTPSNIDSDESISIYETDLERSIRRTRKRFKEYAITNDFELFITFTFALNRHDEAVNRKRFATWLRNQRIRNGRFKYLAVPEYHKDGAVHFHALVGGYNGKLTASINPHSDRPIKDNRGNQVYTLTEYTLGYTKVEVIDSSEGKTKSAYYLQKYITKEANSTDGRQRYWASKNLRLPPTEDNPEEFYKHIPADRHFVNDHGTCLEFDLGTSPLTDWFIEANR